MTAPAPPAHVWVDPRELEALLTAAAADPDAPFVDTITVDEDAHLVLPPDTAAHFGNHSCDPTLWHVGPYELATRRALRPGDEATIDYGTHPGAALTMACRCGAACCREVVTSDDWRRPELRRRYGDHWTPALLVRIAAARADTVGGAARHRYPPEDP